METIDRDARTIAMGDEKADVIRFLVVAATFALGVILGFLSMSWAIVGLPQ